MSDFGSERIMANAKAMSEEEVKAFLTQVDEDLLTEEINRRLKKGKNLEVQGKALFLGNTISDV